MSLIYNILDETEFPLTIEGLLEEIHFEPMINQGKEVSRLVAIQGDMDETGKHPLYRHPIDKQPTLTYWTPWVEKIRDTLSQKVGQQLNHCLIQYYRDGFDHISEHCDKTLDMTFGSHIINYSVGATRTFILKPKKRVKGEECEKIKFSLEHNSLFVLPWELNKTNVHSIKQDRRDSIDKREDEKGPRISFTFRSIATYIDSEGKITGQGARKDGNILEDDSVELLKAFSRENYDYEFDWNELYGKGFNTIVFTKVDELFSSLNLLI